MASPVRVFGSLVYDVSQVIGLPVTEAIALLQANGFTVTPVYDADEEIALTMELMPTRCRLFSARRHRDPSDDRVIACPHTPDS
jgi:hypothetical protein